MTTSALIITELEEARRSAMVSYYLGHVTEDHPEEAARALVTPEDLYEFLLIDPQVNGMVETSGVAMAVASLQQYIHAIHYGMEPGYDGFSDASAMRRWRDSMSQYALWAGNQMLQDYPENYIDPQLRLKQTRAFKEFVSETNQGRISKDGVQIALRNYLDKFESLANIKTISGYISESDIRNSAYYFLGKETGSAGKYWWRKVDISLEELTGDEVAIPPTAWSEWEPVNIPVHNDIIAIRPVWFNGRLHVAWIECKKESDVQPEFNPGDTIRPATRYVWSYNLSWLLTTGQWSPVTTFHSKQSNPPAASVGFCALATNSASNQPLLLAIKNGDDREFVLIDRFYSLKIPEDAEDLSWRYFLESLPFWGGVMQMTNPSSFGKGFEVKHSHAGFPIGSAKGRAAIVAPQLVIADINATLYPLTYKNLVADLFIKENPGLISERHVYKHYPFLSGESVPYYDMILLGFERDLKNEDKIEFGIKFTADSFAGSGYLYTAEITFFDVIKPWPTDLVIPGVITLGDGGQFLDISSLNIKNSHIRLNTTFGKELVHRISKSIDALLNWDTQFIYEGSLPSGAKKVSEIMDFNSANGRYFWELFFHVPHAIAARLHQDFNFQEAENWLNYIFNPLVKHQFKSEGEPVYYWSVRPLTEPGNSSFEIEGIADPDAISYAAPVHYRKAIYLFYIRNLIAHGDMLYRSLTRDALNEAKLVYIRALSLMGPKPDNRMLTRWEPQPLKDVARYNEETFVNFESEILLKDQWAMPVASVTRPWIEILDSDNFRPPLNTTLLSIWDELTSRLSNLRNNLTLDGKPIHLPLYDIPVNPLSLLRAQNSAGGLSQRAVGGPVIVPPYRYRVLLPRAQSAAEMLMRFGDTVRSYREQKERAEQEELVQRHISELSEFGISVQDMGIQAEKESLQALEKSRNAVEHRAEFYERLAVENISTDEQKSMDLKLDANVYGVAAQGIKAVAGATQMASVIVTAFGGGHNRSGAAVDAAADVMSMASAVYATDAERLSTSEMYRRRKQEWEFQRDQAKAEITALDSQIDAARSRIAQFEEQRNQAVLSRNQAEEHYSFLKTRTTSVGLYQWLLSQMSTYYFQAYDAVVSLCLCTEACWQYEMGDFQTHFIQPDVWFDNAFGLGAGEALRLQLQRMENAYLKRNERRLALTRTVSLKELFKQETEGEIDPVQELITKGELGFELPVWLFDHDYPGHFLRQIVSVSVSLPGLLGPYQNIKAILTQTSSKILLKADKEGAHFLYKGSGDAKNILLNPRVSQSIGVSHGMDDNGIHQLSFDGDERYLPFEGTGAISGWHLKFPRYDRTPQQELLASLSDVIIHIRYIAMDGGPQFERDVTLLVDEKLSSGSV
ncbi:neuraminidase-like domain-containing protein [Enterobacter cloacae]|uniref:Tc toxin subunit A-related protein n=1 Tax=Enterobacter cloacae TaxID=550 RepID=UPI0020064FB4|nr:neuraminidase-like domain-containing protein [Enterobacter cloacae]MCK7318540.1 neuraminidase-like domain-containing protein [Enterobacter cloacae]